MLTLKFSQGIWRNSRYGYIHIWILYKEEDLTFLYFKFYGMDYNKIFNDKQNKIYKF